MPTPPSAAPAGAPEADPLVGTVLAQRYRLLRKLGEGGMGSVYLAEHTTIAKRLAIKVLSPEYSHKQDLVDRFLQEARAASMIEQENVVEITDYGSTPTGSVFFVMEYLQGEDLSHTIHREGPLPWSRVGPIMLQICDALGAAHDVGIIHRDMKPENCYRIKRGSNHDFIKVLDFGIAKVTSEVGEGGKGLTRTGMIFGTPEYMSPEQAKGEKVDARVDIYAIGVIMFELLTGKVPFSADTFMGILTKHMFEAPPAPRLVAPNAQIPPEAEAIILKALQKDRELRFQDMGDMARAIAAVGTGAVAVNVVPEELAMPTTGRIEFSQHSTQIPLGDEGRVTQPPTRRSPIWAGALGAVLVGALGGWWFFGRDPGPSGGTPSVAAAAVAPAPSTTAEPTPTVVPDKRGATVSITVETPGIAADVLDGRDLGRLGVTNAPIALPAGDTPLVLVVRAAGYDDTKLEVVPSHDKTLQAALTAVVPAESSTVDAEEPAVSKPKKPRRRGSSAPKPDPVSEQPQSKPTPKQGGSVDLKDPFAD